MAYPVKTPAHCLIQGIGQIGGAQDEDAGVVAVHALHLHQELCLDAPGRLALPIPSAAAQSIDLHSKGHDSAFTTQELTTALQRHERSAEREALSMPTACI